MSIRQADIYTRAAIGRSHGLDDKERMNNVAQIRKAKGLTQIELAEAVGVKQATISRIEKGVNNPSLDVIESIASALGVTVVELFGLPDLEMRVLEGFRAASPQRRAALLALLEPDQE